MRILPELVKVEDNIPLGLENTSLLPENQVLLTSRMGGAHARL
ncbi:hypothetical protein EV07_1180 [Prochlorococcus sp. MIT 0603]|nr:hypothetical protein EV07_1180 [Prochlorococcus sp. MIT 0603]